MGAYLFRWLLVLTAQAGMGEYTDSLAPGWKGNPWGPAAQQARSEGRLEHVPARTPTQQQWDAWGRKVLRDGDILFRLGDARAALGMFPVSRFIARASGSIYSHTGIVAIEDGDPYVYDTTDFGPRRQPLHIWVLDNIGPMGVKRLKAEYRDRIPKVLGYLRDVYQKQVPFDIDLDTSDKALYCVEMTEKAHRAAGVPLSDPIKLGDMERAGDFPVRMMALQYLSSWYCSRPLTYEDYVFFPGNDRFGIWGSSKLTTVHDPMRVDPTVTVDKPNGDRHHVEVPSAGQ